MKILRVTLIVHLLFFASWGGYLLTSHRGATQVWLETFPVDPRDYLSGHYVALYFQANRPDASSCAQFLNISEREKGPNRSGTKIYVYFEPTSRIAHTESGRHTVWTATYCAKLMGPRKKRGKWVQGTLIAEPRGTQILYGIERYFVAENSPLRNAKSGEVLAQVAINNQHKIRIEDLQRIQD